MRATRPLFRLDPGWLFIVAGLALCAAGVLLPAQADLAALDEQLAQLQAEEARAYQRLAAHAEFIDQVDRSEPGMIKRLAAAQLNLVPEGDKPVLLAGANVAPVTDWIDGRLVTDLRPARPEPSSTLSRWANGPSRLWMFGGGIMAVFVGLLVSPEGSRRARRAPVTAAVGVGAGSGHAMWADEQSMLLANERVRGDDDADFNAMLAADDEDESRIIALMRSLPATVDVDDERDLSQQEDTVDLEENELPAYTRSVIDDDAAWHDAAAVEHASELIIEAKEVAPAHGDSMLWADDELPLPALSAASPVTADVEGAEEDAMTPASAHSAQDQDELWAIDDEARLSATSMLLPDSDDDASDAVAPAAKLAKPARESPAKPPKKVALRTAVDVRDSASEDDDEKPSAVVRKTPPSKRGGERKPARRLKQDGAPASIPFLRYRPDEDDEDDENEDAGEGDVVIAGDTSDDDMPSMEADDVQETEAAKAASSDAEAESSDEADDDDAANDRGGSMKFRRR